MYIYFIVEPILSNITWSTIQPIPNNNNLEVIFIKSNEISNDTKLPLVVLPHGGPHVVITPDISLYTTTLVSLGYAVALGILFHVLFIYIYIL